MNDAIKIEMDAKKSSRLEVLLTRTLAFSSQHAKKLFENKKPEDITKYIDKLTTVDEMQRLLAMSINLLKSSPERSKNIIYWIEHFISLKSVAVLSSPILQNQLQQIMNHYLQLQNPASLLRESIIKMDLLFAQERQNGEEESDTAEDETPLVFIDDSDYEGTDNEDDEEALSTSSIDEGMEDDIDVKEAEEEYGESDDDSFNKIAMDNTLFTNDDDEDDDDSQPNESESEDDDLPMDAEDIDGL